MRLANLERSQLIEALTDVADNYGTMWRAENGYVACRRWDALERAGLIEWNPWADRFLPSDAGLRALSLAGRTK